MLTADETERRVRTIRMEFPELIVQRRVYASTGEHVVIIREPGLAKT